ncbi:MAG: tetratricopeptide repeat protein, partial [Verrucomicrobiales bacterium]|nr:tetratricopeptide repeat protein [Verrucomicrobiales bacterium]
MSRLLVPCILVVGALSMLRSSGQEVVEDPFAPRFDLDEARALVETGEYTAAVELTAEAREVGWRSAGWQRVRIDALLATGNYEAAAAAAVTLATDYGRDLPTLVYVREVLVRVGETETAERVLEFINRFATAMGTGDEDFDTAEIVALGKAALNMGAEAKFVLEQFFGTARKRNPKLVEAHLEAAELALEKFDYGLAAQYLGEGVEFCGDRADFRFGLARAFAPSDGRLADEHIAAALELNPLHFPTLLLVAGEKLDGDEFDDAKAVVEKVLGSDEHHPEALALKSVVAYLENDFEVHAQARNEALRYWKDNPRVDHLIGEKLSRKRR